MTAFAILFTMAAIGISETVYLIRKRKEGDKPLCPIGGGCSTVLESKYNSIFGVHNDLLGLLFYLASGFLTALIVLEIGPTAVLTNVVGLMICGALAMSVVFTYLQAFVIKSWCFWCVMSALTIVVMALTLLGFIVSL